MVLVDTSAMVEFFRRAGALEVKLAVRGLLDAFEATLCGPVELEFLGGARRDEKDRIQAWLNILPYLRNDQKLWRKGAETYSRLRAEGVTVKWNDALIATLALDADCRVYAVDKHFTAMAPVLGLKLYTPGYAGTYRPESEEP
jgi:predicted nucleic acid-binding protein